LFGILYAPLEGWMAIAVRSISRHHEYAADRFSVETTNNRSTMMNALKKLSIDNLSCLQPHSFYVFLNYSHPPVPKRIEAIEKIEINYPAPGQRS
jgi:STE24 endopeptidase